MKCPHCLIAFHSDRRWKPIGPDADGYWAVSCNKCPSCDRLVLVLASGSAVSSGGGGGFAELTSIRQSFLIRPKGSARPCPPEVPPGLAEDFGEACLVLSDSPKASAALSRRCLQHLLREHAGVKHRDLAKEIQAVIDSGQLPSHLTDSIDHIRNTGNFAAHPMKSTNTGEVLPVEPGEAEWNLDVLELLFDFYFVAPEKAKKRRAALDAKLAEAGKPPLKGAPLEEAEDDA